MITSNGLEGLGFEPFIDFRLKDDGDGVYISEWNPAQPVPSVAEIEQGEQVYIDDGRGHFVFDNITHRPAEAAGGAGSGQIKASMDGAIVEVLVKEGDQVEAGQTIVVLEAMKMEHQLKSGISGTVNSINTQAGQQVKTKQLLASITAADEAEA